MRDVPAAQPRAEQVGQCRLGGVGGRLRIQPNLSVAPRRAGDEREACLDPDGLAGQRRSAGGASGTAMRGVRKMQR
jgi:hypothetical protein